jgi:hypothetical protein
VLIASRVEISADTMKGPEKHRQTAAHHAGLVTASGNVWITVKEGYTRAGADKATGIKANEKTDKSGGSSITGRRKK